MENAYTDIRTGSFVASLPALFRMTAKAVERIREAQARLAKALGIEREQLYCQKAILPAGKWGEKNDVSFDACSDMRGIPCRPIHFWSMILQENKIRKPQQPSFIKRR